MRTSIRVLTGWIAAISLRVGGLAGVESHSVEGVASTDSSSAFSAFSRPQRATDEVPASLWTPVDTTPTVPDIHTSRRSATSESLAVYLVHTDTDVLCLVVQELPGQATGGLVCSPGPNVIAHGMVEGWSVGTADPTNDSTAVLVPDGYTAAIVKGTFEL